MPSPQKLAFAAWGDPLDASTWSGTSSHLAGAFQALGIEIIALNCRPSQAKLGVEHLSHRAQGLAIDYTRRQAGRRICAQLTRNLPSDCAGVLHMSDVTVPRRGATPGVRHFLLCDATHDFYLRCNSEIADTTPRRRQAAQRHERDAIAGTDLFFPLSQHAAHSLRSVYGVDEGKITVVGTGRGKIAPFEGPKNYAAKKILMVAKQRFEDKGGPLLLQAFKIARRRDPDLHLTLVSPAEFGHFAQGIEGVTVTGTVSWPELQELFNGACLYAMPALCEPWGLVYAEALAAKTPILGLNRAALPELTGEGRYGFLVEGEAPEAVAQALLQAVSDPSRLQHMGEAGQKYCLETFRWERSAQRIADAVFR